MKERKIHLDIEDAAVATTSGLIYGVAIGGTLFLEADALHAVKTGLAITPLALVGALKAHLREKLTKESNE